MVKSKFLHKIPKCCLETKSARYICHLEEVVYSKFDKPYKTQFIQSLCRMYNRWRVNPGLGSYDYGIGMKNINVHILHTRTHTIYIYTRACHWSCVFWRDFSGVKRTCWTTGSWRSCLSLEVVGSIPAGSTIIYRFLCGFICVSLCQSIKIKPTNMYIASARAQFKINTHRCWNWHLCIPDGLSVVQCSHGHFIGVAFFGAIVSFRFEYRLPVPEHRN